MTDIALRRTIFRLRFMDINGINKLMLMLTLTEAGDKLPNGGDQLPNAENQLPNSRCRVPNAGDLLPK